MAIRIQKNIANRAIVLETGRLAKQANGAVFLQCGNTVMLATATMAKETTEGTDFLPLMVEYAEKMYAAGKIPGGFFKRESRPSTDATLTARLIDRPLRPCFPKGLYRSIQVVITVLSYDDSFAPESLGVLAGSAALHISDIPFNSPVGATMISLIDGKLIANAEAKDLDKSDLNIMVAGTKDAILMVEAEAKEVSEETIIEAINLAKEPIRQQIEMQEEMALQVNKEKNMDVLITIDNPKLEQKINEFLADKIETNLRKGNKAETEMALKTIEEEVLQEFIDENTNNESEVKFYFNKLKKEKIRATIIKEKIRPDGRKLNEIRPITSEVSVLPMAHGSALFTRGETQSLAVTTLGTADDEQIIDGLTNATKKQYFFHYNFPPFSVGEVGRLGTGRRELGHGALAEKSLKAVLPNHDEFPYTIRVVSEILESNGSSSMASVCGGCLSLMDAGVPIKRPVSGIAMGLLMDGEDYTILSDIQGLEDHYGDMDFKVAGTEKGITALQLDIKISGLSDEILRTSLYQAKEGRAFILGKMLDVLDVPRHDLSEYAPKIENMTVPVEKIGIIIGSGGKMIKKLEEETGAKIIIADGDDGQIMIASRNMANVEKARNMIHILVKDVEPGDVYEGKIVKIMNFGLFVEIVPGKDGLIHISNIPKGKGSLEDRFNIGDIILVKVREIDNQNRINLVPINQNY